VWYVFAGDIYQFLEAGARLDDGELNITIFPSKSKFRMMTKLLPKVATGAHIKEPGVSYFPGRRVEVDTAPFSILELDGDIFGTTPATFTVCPGVLQVMIPATPPVVASPEVFGTSSGVGDDG